MKALVYHGNRDLRLQDWPNPSPGPGEALLRVDYCGICATDIEEYLYGPVFIAGEEPNPVTGKKMPMVTGHEITATVMEVNGSNADVAPGDRVAINGVLTCGDCYWCTSGELTQCPGMAAVGFGIDGGLAERLVWRSDQLVKIPSDLSSEEAALTEPTAVAIHAVKRSGSGRHGGGAGRGNRRIARDAGSEVVWCDGVRRGHAPDESGPRPRARRG